MKRAGELGLLGTDVPEELGGVGLDKVASIIVGEAVGRVASFATTFGAQTGLAITPLLCFGTEAQKAKYLPGLVSGETTGAYALSESGSGSDALGAKARAMRQPDGSFLLSGEKMWITNGGFADFFIVFAKVDNTDFTAFLVERAFPGVSSGKEEHKMGLHGSSTTPLILQDVKVPAENVLGEIGKGHKVAFNVLNYGRFKLAAMCSGGARAIVGEAAKYAAERKQFGQPIASFGAIKHKLAEIVDPALRRREHALSHRRADRRRAPGEPRQRGHPRRAGGVRHRGVDPQGRGQRDARLRRGRERPDPRRQRVRPRLPGRAALPRRARQPDLRGDQRDQPPADSRHADPPRAEGRPAAHSRGEEAAGRDPHAVDARAGVGRAARGRAPRPWRR